ncbi:MAG: S-adenosylmethionine:tRNA ribosyltransferase-isomerase [Vicinamibacterales bacterium]
MAATGVIASFELPSHLEAAEPPEARGLARDEVRLLVSDIGRDAIEHARFRDLPHWLAPGDVLVVNTSGTLPAAVPAIAADHEAATTAAGTSPGNDYDVHLSTELGDGTWIVELRRPDAFASSPCRDAHAGMELELPGGARARMIAPYPSTLVPHSPSRLWKAHVSLTAPTAEYLNRHGFPIRYRYVPEPWPIAMYQTVFANEPGSAEMPSAGRPFTPELVARLVSRGVQFAPLLLHTGVASLEDHEPPYEEFYRVSPETAAIVNNARRSGHRLVAIGTTVVRALETVTTDEGTTRAGEGWTNLVIGLDRPLRSVNSIITGLHEPHATHLALLERVIDAAARAQPTPRPRPRELQLEHAYREAMRAGYLWHEFGDAHLILGPG